MWGYATSLKNEIFLESEPSKQAAPTSTLFLAVPEPFGLGVRLWLARFGEAKRGGVLRVVGNDLARQAVHRHGITHEPHAVRNYERALRCRGHSIQTTCCGIMVDPSLPWLGASPDRLVYDPKEPVPHEVLEVKCPYTMYHSSDPDSQTFYMRGTQQCKGIFRDPEQRSSGSQSFTLSLEKGVPVCPAHLRRGKRAPVLLAPINPWVTLAGAARCSFPNMTTV
ncbi:hypothetical protein HPB47_001656 [Ixodes persulcatus]|uniref:Uncharacterized protein n=1 Tax=Ixodes persulcatus TaxID=34615 RepID=A0AC60PNE0_IXOPE|nr:hypothetical protein HPB47_001656 [Ixodes persulcatus]